MRFARRNSPFVDCVVASLGAPHGPCAHTHMRCQVTSCYRVSSCDRRCCRMNNNIQLHLNAEAADRDNYVCSQQARVYNSMSLYSCTTKTPQHEPQSKLLENWFKLYNIPFISLSHPCCIITFSPRMCGNNPFLFSHKILDNPKRVGSLLGFSPQRCAAPFYERSRGTITTNRT